MAEIAKALMLNWYRFYLKCQYAADAEDATPLLTVDISKGTRVLHRLPQRPSNYLEHFLGAGLAQICLRKSRRIRVTEVQKVR